MTKWRIYYDDGTAFSSNEGEPWEAPRLGVMVIVMAHPQNGRSLVTRKEYYWWDAERELWFGGELFGLYDHLTHASRQCAVMGRFVSNDEFLAALELAHRDSDFPPMSARDPDGRDY